jgi:hypothetical protein
MIELLTFFRFASTWNCFHVETAYTQNVEEVWSAENLFTPMKRKLVIIKQ